LRARPALLPPFLTTGSWIGGDRDGNPNVDAETLEQALLRQATHAFRYYLDEIKALGTELSMSRTLVSVTPELEALPTDSRDTSLHRIDEPYRRACIHIYARLAATAKQTLGRSLASRPTYETDPYADPSAFENDPLTISQSLEANQGTARAPLRLGHRRQACRRFVLHLAAPAMRQRSDVSAEVLVELFSAAGVSWTGDPVPYFVLSEAQPVVVCRGELAPPR